MFVTEKHVRLVGEDHTVVLLNAPAPVRAWASRRWSEVGVPWWQLEREIRAQGLPAPSASREKAGKFLPGGAYARSWSEGELTWDPRKAHIRQCA